MRQCNIWAVTSYFNPFQYRRRLRNYKLFRHFLSIPLVAVELAYGNEFELQEGDADILVRIRGHSVMWQKERLLNIALANIPQSVQFVAWLDCDVIIGRPDWPEQAIAALRDKELVQLFSELHDLQPDALPPDSDANLTPTGRSIAYLNASSAWKVDDFRPSNTLQMRQAAFGLAWAAKRRLLDRHQFYDAMVLGSGDRALACAAMGRFEDAIRTICLNERRSAHYLDWAKPFFDDVSGNVHFVDGRLFHLWHGDLKDRRYAERHIAFAALNFDPATDLTLNNEGVFQWSEMKPEFEVFARSYFASRNEDGI